VPEDQGARITTASSRADQEVTLPALKGRSWRRP